MAFINTREDDTQESLDQQLKEAGEELAAGRLSQAEYDALAVQIEAKRAMLTVAPTLDANAEARLKDLEYLHERKWISDEDYEAQKREILGGL